MAILIQPSEDHQKGFIQDVFNQPIHFNNVAFAYNDNQNVLKIHIILSTAWEDDCNCRS